ncbi:auxin-responsive protein SAUR71 [Carica papaya]|uniref:auxin-responsive protein SAUR71 n=1 Tax=Carica papaya TaxID=3649 RepID=UPI000B8CF0CB|nr:auxin-responsive protein SAUR71 [Carica papaya]
MENVERTLKNWPERSQSVGLKESKNKSFSSSGSPIKKIIMLKSKSWHGTSSSSSSPKADSNKKQKKIAPEGCFTVYVGPERQRFVVNTKFASHPLFKMLLEDAEMEYGYSSQGPILLPCDVDLFYKVLAEMEELTTPVCSVAKGYYSPFTLCSPITPRRSNSSSTTYKGFGRYQLLKPSRMLKLDT